MADIVYPYTKFRYRLEIDGIDAGGFSEVTGFDSLLMLLNIVKETWCRHL